MDHHPAAAHFGTGAGEEHQFKAVDALWRILSRSFRASFSAFSLFRVAIVVAAFLCFLNSRRFEDRRPRSDSDIGDISLSSPVGG
jgi:hypothetical protein